MFRKVNAQMSAGIPLGVKAGVLVVKLDNDFSKYSILGFFPAGGRR